MLLQNIIEIDIKKGENNVYETISTFEQYCTYLEKNIIIEEIIYHDGERKFICINNNCMNDEKGCKNRLRLLTE